jgi:hypothetical protein
MDVFGVFVNTNSPVVLLLTRSAAQEGWEDKTFYGDPDCDLSQIFTQGSRVLTVTWAGEGTHERILDVELRSTKALQRRRDGVLYYNEVDGQRELLTAALMALHTVPSP